MANISVPAVFDFGTSDLYTGSETVYGPDHTDAYDSGVGWGWTNTSGLASGTRTHADALLKDYVTGGTAAKTFQVDIANGTYEISVIVGDYGGTRSTNVSVDGSQKALAYTVVDADDDFTFGTVNFSHTVSTGQIDFEFDDAGVGNWAVLGIRITSTTSTAPTLTIPCTIDIGYGDKYAGTGEQMYYATGAWCSPLLDGFGWIEHGTVCPISLVRSGLGGNDLNYDAVAFSGGRNTFRVYLPNGTYNFTLHTGDLHSAGARAWDLYIDDVLDQAVSTAGAEVQQIAIENHTVSSGYVDFGFDDSSGYGLFNGLEIEEAGGGTEEATPSAVGISVGVNAPTVTFHVGTAPAATTKTWSINSPTIAFHVETTPTAVSRSLAVNAPTAAGIVETSPNAVTRTLAVPAPTVQGLTGSIPDPVTRTWSINAPSVTARVATSPAQVTSTVTVNAPTVAGIVETSPAAVARSITVPAPTAEGSSGAEVDAAVVQRTLAVNAPTTNGIVDQTLAVVSRAVTVNAPTVTVHENPTPAPVNITMTVHNAGVSFIDPNATGGGMLLLGVG